MPVNLTAVEAWQVLKATEGLAERNTYSYLDVLSTVQAFGGSRDDILRVVTIETIFRRLNK